MVKPLRQPLKCSTGNEVSSPKLPENSGVECILCGCTEDNACLDENKVPCHWMIKDESNKAGLCSACWSYLVHYRHALIKMLPVPREEELVYGRKGNLRKSKKP